MVGRRLVCGALGVGMLALAPLASPAVAQASPLGCTVRPVLAQPLVIRQNNRLLHPPLRTTCLLAAPTLTIYDSTGKIAGYISWPGNSNSVVGNGARGNWTSYDVNWVVGKIYTVQSQTVYASDYQHHYQTVAVSFRAKDATSVSLTARRATGRIELSGISRQYSHDANYGAGGQAPHAETVRLQYRVGAGWKTLKTLRTPADGSYGWTHMAPAGRVYRALVVATTSVIGSASASRTARG